jgi:hypothetical protein
MDCMQVPDHLDLTALRASGAQPGEVLLADDGEDGGAAGGAAHTVPDAGLMEQMEVRLEVLF